LEHFLYPKTKPELAREKLTVQQGVYTQMSFEGHQTRNGWGLTGIGQIQRLLSSY
jgi:hypothetical protein